ncbi:winged helix-turn-helix domain-containing protein [Aeromonas veronii]|uniref:winged helix-turn-helix domain-containing protein n=1 Tax=Aeromonas veronii TaxID=654 RepID=UPI003B982060
MLHFACSALTGGSLSGDWSIKAIVLKICLSVRSFVQIKSIAHFVLFFSNFNLTVSKADIFNYVWPDGRCVSPGSVSVMVYDLRILLSDQNIDIVNVRGVGYRLESRRSGR